jgi:hypothetical protein
LKESFAQFQTMVILLKEVLQKLGTEHGKKFVNECGSHVFNENSSDLMNDICDFIFVKYRHVFMGIGQGAAEGMSHSGNSTAKKLQTILTVIPTLLVVKDLLTISNTMHEKLKNIMNKMEKNDKSSI